MKKHFFLLFFVLYLFIDNERRNKLSLVFYKEELGEIMKSHCLCFFSFILFCKAIFMRLFYDDNVSKNTKNKSIKKANFALPVYCFCECFVTF